MKLVACVDVTADAGTPDISSVIEEVRQAVEDGVRQVLSTLPGLHVHVSVDYDSSWTTGTSVPPVPTV